MNYFYSSFPTGPLLLSMVMAPPLSGNSEYAPEPEAVFETGRLCRYGKINVLDLRGSFLEMGHQYGSLMSEQLQILYQKAIIDHFMDRKGLSRKSMLQAAKGLYNFYPQRFKDIILGMSKTSGLSLDDQIILNALELYGLMPGCSAVFAWDEYTHDGQLIAGRNYDWFDSYADFAESLTVTVFHPDSGIPAAIITFAGVIYATTGINAQGLFLELNNAFPSGGGLTYKNRVCAMSNLLAFLVDYQNMDQLDAAMNTTRSNFSFIINTADRHTAVSYEWPPFDLRQRPGDAPGLLVSTNHFINPAWGLTMQENTGFKSVLRRDNLLKLGRQSKGKIDVRAMKNILDTPIEKGGATWPEQGQVRTIYQIIATPVNQQIWIKVPGCQDWISIELQRFFARK
ncbi:MAG: C45 family autoproteolytic acyltransferase/hydrolase [Desulfonatronovibrio sp.]